MQTQIRTRQTDSEGRTVRRSTTGGGEEKKIGMEIVAGEGRSARWSFAGEGQSARWSVAGETIGEKERCRRRGGEEDWNEVREAAAGKNRAEQGGGG